MPISLDEKTTLQWKEIPIYFRKHFNPSPKKKYPFPSPIRGGQGGADARTAP
jgi:hypothetical protein